MRKLSSTLFTILLFIQLPYYQTLGLNSIEFDLKKVDTITPL